jgi:hypothetical protein
MPSLSTLPSFVRSWDHPSQDRIAGDGNRTGLLAVLPFMAVQALGRTARVVLNRGVEVSGSSPVKSRIAVQSQWRVSNLRSDFVFLSRRGAHA